MATNDWADALRKVWDEFNGHPPSWGYFDCCQMAARYVEELTGVNHAANFAYDSRNGASRILLEAGGMESLISKFMGPAKPEAEPGDLVLCAIKINEHTVYTPGITNGSYVLTIHPDEGIGKASNRCIQKAWSCHK
jgi:hypothetical protein